MRMLKIIGLILSLILGASLGMCQQKNANTDKLINRLTVAEPFKLSLFAHQSLGHELRGARLMTVGPDGHLYLSLTRQNKVVMLQDQNQDGVADDVVIVLDHDLNAPHGLAFVGDTLLIANQDRVISVEKHQGQWPAQKISVLIEGLPTGGHTLKSIKLGPDGYLYMNVGSSCNVCVEDDPTRASLLRFTPEGKPAGYLKTVGMHAQSALWASGLRNTQGFAWHPTSGALFATNEGADNRAPTKGGMVDETIPPEHLNVIKPGEHYGWPYCWGKQVADPNFGQDIKFCQRTTGPEFTFDSHSTPIGIAFLHSAKVPPAIQQDALVALHGSWNRVNPSGYKVVLVKFNDNQPVAVEDFITGWLEGKKHWGRPVDVIVGSDKAIYISDDEMGAIYRITIKE